VDSASPLLLSKLCTGEHFDTIGLIFTQSDPHGGESVHSTITLTNATISSYKIYRGFIPSPKSNPKHGASSVHSNELEEFQLVFQKIAFTNTKGSKSTSDDWTA